MIVRWLTVFLFLLTSCTSIPPRPPPDPPPIIGTVAVTTSHRRSHCTGTAIGPKLVVTAAHCLYAFNLLHNRYELVMPSDLLVMSGYRSLASAPDSAFIKVVRFEKHPGFPNYKGAKLNADGMGRWDDIALLFLAKPVQVDPVPILPLHRVDSVIHRGSPVYIAGYGTQGVLVEAMTPYKYRTTHEIWVGAPGYPDSCSGDSGGPTMVKVNNIFYLIGATSRAGLKSKHLCGEGGISTLVSAYIGWIHNQINHPPITEKHQHSKVSNYLALILGSMLFSWGLIRRLFRHKEIENGRRYKARGKRIPTTPQGG